MKLEQPPPQIRLAPLELQALRVLPSHELLESAAHILHCNLDRAGEILASACGLHWLPTSTNALLTVRTDRVSLAEAKGRRCLIGETGESCFGVLVDPFSQATRVFLESANFPLPLKLALIANGDFDAILQRAEAEHRFLGSDQAAHETISTDIEESALALESVADSPSSAVGLINAVFLDALKATASDIHIESTPHGTGAEVSCGWFVGNDADRQRPPSSRTSAVAFESTGEPGYRRAATPTRRPL